MEKNTEKQIYTFVNICTKNRTFVLAVILGKNKRRGF
jgi:hypothetical protein